MTQLLVFIIFAQVNEGKLFLKLEDRVTKQKGDL